MQSCHVSVRSVSHFYPRGDDAPLEALRDFSLEVNEGEFVSVVGPSGSGKSTLLRIAGGLLQPSQGEVFIDDESPREAQRHMKVGYVFQEPALLPWRKVRRNIGLPLELSGDGLDGRRVDDLIELVGLSQFAEYEPRHLSGGMQQRVAIARALAFDPPLLLMDEPFGALDEITRESMRLELQRIWSMARKTVIFVTHSIREAVLLSDHVVVLSPAPGRIQDIVEVGLPRPRTEATESEGQFLERLSTVRDALRGVPV
jgi:NitT/TauT family transport system ATP-binding protein